jgi:hypothetical protein
VRKEDEIEMDGCIDGCMNQSIDALVWIAVDCLILSGSCNAVLSHSVIIKNK